MWSMLHCRHSSVRMSVADDLVPISHQGICNNSDDIGWSAHVSHAMASHLQAILCRLISCHASKNYLGRSVDGSSINSGTISTQRHYLSQHLSFVNWIPENKFQRNLNQNGTIFVQENEIENNICRMAHNLLWLRCVNIAASTFYLLVTVYSTSPVYSCFSWVQ